MEDKTLTLEQAKAIEATLNAFVLALTNLIESLTLLSNNMREVAKCFQEIPEVKVKEGISPLR